MLRLLALSTFFVILQIRSGESGLQKHGNMRVSVLPFAKRVFLFGKQLVVYGILVGRLVPSSVKNTNSGFINAGRMAGSFLSGTEGVSA